VSVIVTASNVTQTKEFSMATTTDFKVQIEKLEGPEDWSK
jgi:hypothetical protein